MSARPIRLTLLFVATAALGGDDPIPWPGGEAPSATTLQIQVDDARALFELERAEAFLEASEKGEDREHIAVFQEDIDAGLWDKDDLFAFGHAVFGHVFRDEDGFGASPHASLRRVHVGAYGGPDTFSCADCHSVGGPGGAGSITQNAFFFGDGEIPSNAVIRNAPHALGLGFVQALAAEMTADLHALREQGTTQATMSGESVRIDLVTKGVAFGSLLVDPDARIDTSDVRGIDRDLVVRPFGWKGTFATLRRLVEDEARVHFGVQSHVLALGWQDMPDPERLGPGPDWWDPDADGQQRELEEGSLTATVVYLAMVESPVVIPPHDPALRDRWTHGSALFDAVGCGECHRRELVLTSPFWEEVSDTTDADPVRISLLEDGEMPKASPRVGLFSDLRRHDMGSELADPLPVAGVAASQFLTRPLWGLAETAPYLHDGRAATIPEAIELHGGEAAEFRDAYLELADRERADLHVFLLSLTRAPKVRFAG
jgi:hypothetical protein